MELSRRRLLAASVLGLAPTSKSWAADDQRFVEITKKSEEAALRGTEFLMKVRRRDGAYGVDIGQPPDIGCTSIVGLSLLVQGNTPVEGPRSNEVQKIVSFLLQRIDQMPQDDITAQTSTQLQRKIGRHAHSFFAALFLSQVMGEDSAPEPIRRRLSKLVKTITAAQHGAGHWGGQGTSWAPTLGTVMGWVSLYASHLSGFKVKATKDKTTEHLIAMMRSKIAVQKGSWMHTLYKNAAAIRVLYAAQLENDPVSKKALADVISVVTKDNTPFSQAGGEEYLAFHLITDTLLQKGGADWKAWYPVVRDKMIGVQNVDGSWTGRHCITSRTFCTAAAILTLMAPNRYLPISQQ